jgi:hypothetical protein
LRFASLPIAAITSVGQFFTWWVAFYFALEARNKVATLADKEVSLDEERSDELTMPSRPAKIIIHNPNPLCDSLRSSQLSSFFIDSVLTNMISNVAGMLFVTFRAMNCVMETSSLGERE